MKTALLLLAASIGSTIAAPAIVWKNTPSTTGPSHISNAISTRSLLTSVKSNENEQDESALSAVIFLVGRTTDGTEGLSALASSGKLPSVQEKHRGATEVHHHVQGVESSRTIAKDVTKSKLGNNVAEVSMKEFTRKLSSIAQVEVEAADNKITKVEQKRRRAISEADVLVVNIGAHEDPAKIDAAIVAAIDSSSVRNVILSTIRSTKEVKHARKLATMEKRSSPKMTSADASAQSNANGGSSYNGNGRRLEDEDNNENNENNQNQNQADEEGVYYVNMTPNILAGLLFFFMFVMTAHLGLTCMNAIEGQDVYVKKLPAIGREV